MYKHICQLAYKLCAHVQLLITRMTLKFYRKGSPAVSISH